MNVDRTELLIDRLTSFLTDDFRDDSLISDGDDTFCLITIKKQINALRTIPLSGFVINVNYHILIVKNTTHDVKVSSVSVCTLGS